MKKIILFILFATNFAFGQTPADNMHEKWFFSYCDSLQTNNNDNPSFEKIKDNAKLRAVLIKKLESYLIVFVSNWVAPMYLEDSNDIRATKEYVRAYYAAGNSRYDVQKDKFKSIKNLLIELTELNKSKNDSVEKYLAEFKYPFTLEYLFQTSKKEYFDDAKDNPMYLMPQLTKEQNLRTLANRMDVLDNKHYMHYENYHSKPNFLKGFEMYHENDFLIPFIGLNQDRELTGGFKFSVITDYLKWRWLRLTNKQADNVLSYQTISLLGSGYTPYIRYRNNFSLSDSLHNYDRPFASFFCIERAKHRTWKKGLVRHRGEFQIGAMGISQGRKIQAQLHEDIVTSSQFVYGWDKQIANGGRLVIQANHKLDLLLFSNTSRYKTVFRPNSFLIDEVKKYNGRNIIGEVEFRIGTIMTTAGLGIRFSTLDFLKQSGNQMIKSKNNAKDDFGWKFDVGLNYRYVVHNSLLEGMGLFRTFDEDPYDKVSKDAFVLNKNEIERNMFVFDFGVNFKWRKTTVFYRQNYHTLEYRSRLRNIDFKNVNLTSSINPKDVEYYKSTVIEEQNSFLNFKAFGKQVYGFGILGISWMIE